MTRTMVSERAGKEGKLRLGCSAVIFDAARQKVLLTRRADNGQWCLPSGGVEPGESVAEACAREVWEETGLRVRIVRLTGVYSNPHRLVIYPDGNKAHIVALNFEAEILSGEPGLSDETTDWKYFSFAEMGALDMISDHRERVRETMLDVPAAFIH
jgi:8-oxo-dGTP pyrophosphatase MutT (NUDIX family)